MRTLGAGLDSRTTTLFSGWGRTAPTAAVAAHPETAAEISALLEAAAGAPGPSAGIIARGLGRSYGDAAQCAGGTVLDMTGLDGIGPIDPVTGLVRVEAGVSLHQLLQAALPFGWFIPVSPGTRQVTVGGAIAADIHGKNHHVDGSFCRHVVELTLATPSGTFTLEPASDPDLFWATAGGMGLTGVILAAVVRLIPVETSWMDVETRRFPDLDSTMSEMERSDSAFRYSVAWVDTTPGRSLGRAILTRGDHAPRDALSGSQAGSAYRLPGEPRLRIPFQAPRGVMNATSISLFNELWFRKARRESSQALQPFGPFFHPLDGVADWNLVYGPAGFVQYQFCVGPGRGEVVAQVLQLLAAERLPAFLGVLKRFGPANPGPLSFPMEGWTLALDLPVGPPHLRQVLERLDDVVVEAGGRVYLAKDARIGPAHLAAMYPKLTEFTAIRRRADPDGVLRSDQSRRLGLDRLGSR